MRKAGCQLADCGQQHFSLFIFHFSFLILKLRPVMAHCFISNAMRVKAVETEELLPRSHGGKMFGEG